MVRCGLLSPYNRCDNIVYLQHNSDGVFKFIGVCDKCGRELHLLDDDSVWMATPIQCFGDREYSNIVKSNREYWRSTFNLDVCRFTPNGKLHIVDPGSTVDFEKIFRVSLLCMFEPKKFTGYDRFSIPTVVDNLEYTFSHYDFCKKCALYFKKTLIAYFM